MRILLKASALLACLTPALLSCTESVTEAPPDQTLGGNLVSGALLQRGERGYRTVCASCHGVDGDGNGRLGIHQKPKPRSFAHGIIKFASVPAGSLWRDDDVLRTLHRGLRGTQMIAIKLPDTELNVIVQYLKTFSPRFLTEVPARPVQIATDPFTPSSRDRAIARGKALYTLHCADCHDNQREVPTIWTQPVSTPDLRGYQTKAGSEADTLYRTLAAGIGGIEGKEGLVGVLPAEDIWALVYYVSTLVEPD